MFSCWMYFYEIFNQNKDKQAFHINTFLITYQFLNNTQSCSTCSLIGKKGGCVRSRHDVTPAGEKVFLPWVNLLTHSDLLSVGFQFAPLARNTDGSLSASPISSWIFCVFFSSFKQLFETTTGILSIISWKFVVVCLKYNWLYTIVLTFQTALSTFILITHLCIDFFFFF